MHVPQEKCSINMTSAETPQLTLEEVLHSDGEDLKSHNQDALMECNIFVEDVQKMYAWFDWVDLYLARNRLLCGHHFGFIRRNGEESKTIKLEEEAREACLEISSRFRFRL
ncbi:hypothetical protein L6452_19605 [Arctium lappa]|uniref:Uncharacterized protein n=1 Tax=Arctium lappa TaxID=4217 RepID=A0ACB9B9G2_ARCLA|nr:hypothetical protein L6452_19605 [Arctium lappa]